MRNWLVGAILACAAASATAQILPSPPGYIGVGYGISRYHDFCGPLPPGFDCDEDAAAWRVQAGYMFRPWIGLEGAFIHAGDAHAPGFLLNPPPNTTPLPSTGDGRTSIYALSAIFRAPLGPVGLHAKVGYGAVTSKANATAAVRDNTTGAVTFFRASARETRGRVVYGLGATYDVTRQWHARFDWDRTEGKDNINPKYDVDAYTLGIGYRF
ncbi:MAG TPA: outer membrane beta-barrel protein [Burkholderiaceae bacterium]|nr:outer membrane beta-barrel protein [Burkholderiaceae bacterium]